MADDVLLIIDYSFPIVLLILSPMMDPWSIFLYGTKASMTREKYRGRLAKFFDFIGLTEGTMEERDRHRSLTRNRTGCS